MEAESYDEMVRRTNAEFAKDYAAQRAFIVTAVLVAVVLIGYFAAYNWQNVTVAAQATPSAGAATQPAAAEDRISEISRSQDRFQQTILAVVGSAAAGVVIVVGFNAWTANRNFDRESKILREYGEFAGRQETERARTALQETIDRAQTDLQSAVKTRAQSLQTDLESKIGGAMVDLSRHIDAEQAKLKDYVDDVMEAARLSADDASKVMEAARLSADDASKAMQEASQIRDATERVQRIASGDLTRQFASAIELIATALEELGAAHALRYEAWRILYDLGIRIVKSGFERFENDSADVLHLDATAMIDAGFRCINQALYEHDHQGQMPEWNGAPYLEKLVDSAFSNVFLDVAVLRSIKAWLDKHT